jgi:hypothetical protein
LKLKREDESSFWSDDQKKREAGTEFGGGEKFGIHKQNRVWHTSTTKMYWQCFVSGKELNRNDLLRWRQDSRYTVFFCSMSFKLSVANNLFMLGVVMLNVLVPFIKNLKKFCYWVSIYLNSYNNISIILKV